MLITLIRRPRIVQCVLAFLLANPWCGEDSLTRGQEMTGATGIDDPGLAALMADASIGPALAKAIHFRETGKYDEALESLRGVNALLKKQRSNNHPDQVPVLEMAGQILVEAGRKNDALGPLRKAVLVRESLIASGTGSEDEGLAATLLLLAAIEGQAGRAEGGIDSLVETVRLPDGSAAGEHESTTTARKNLKRALAIFEKSLGLGHPASIRTLRELVSLENAVGNHAAAVDLLTRLMECLRADRGDEDPELVDLVLESANLRIWQGQAGEAVEAAKLAVEKSGSTADGAPQRADNLRRFGECLLLAGDASAAEVVLSEALALDRETHGEDHASVVIDRLMQLRSANDQIGGLAETDQVGDCIKRLRTLATAGDPLAARGLRLAASLAIALGDTETAADCARRALALDSKALEADHPDLIADHELQANILVANADWTGARDAYKEAHRLARTAYGPSNTPTLRLARCIGECELRLKNLKSAARIASTLIDRRVSVGSPRDEVRLCDLVDGVAVGLDKANESAEASAILERFVMLRQEQLGPADPGLADLLVNLGNARQADRQWEAAIDRYLQAIKIAEQSAGADHPDLAAMLIPLARAYRSAQRHDEARNVLVQAAEIWSKWVDPQHPVARETNRLLALTELSLGHPEAALPLMDKVLASYDADPNANPNELRRLLIKMAELRAMTGEIDLARQHLDRAIAVQNASEPGSEADIADRASIARIEKKISEAQRPEKN